MNQTTFIIIEFFMYPYISQSHNSTLPMKTIISLMKFRQTQYNNITYKHFIQYQLCTTQIFKVPVFGCVPTLPTPLFLCSPEHQGSLAYSSAESMSGYICPPRPHTSCEATFVGQVEAPMSRLLVDSSSSHQLLSSQTWRAFSAPEVQDPSCRN